MGTRYGTSLHHGGPAQYGSRSRGKFDRTCSPSDRMGRGSLRDSKGPKASSSPLPSDDGVDDVSFGASLV